MMKRQTTKNESKAQSTTSRLVSVKIEVEPKRVEQTSPERFAEVENTFMTR